MSVQAHGCRTAVTHSGCVRRRCKSAAALIGRRYAEDARQKSGRDYHAVLEIAGPRLLSPLLKEPGALVLREWPRQHVYSDDLRAEVLTQEPDGGNYRTGKPWWLHWRHLANKKSVYHPQNITRPPLRGADGKACDA